MLQLIYCEMKKFKATYINLLALLGMISPVFLMGIAFIVAKEDFVAVNAYNWYSFSTRIVEAFVFLVGPLITCFLSVCSVFYEYQCKTMKNILATPYSRIQIILAKVFYLSLLIMILYGCVAIANVCMALLLGFPITMTEILQYSGYLLLAGLGTTIIIPLTLILTLLCRSFIPAMVISVAGIVPNISAYQWDKCYVSPWAAPEVLVLVRAGYMDVDIKYPIISAVIYMFLFMTVLLLYFNKADQHC